MYFTPKSKEEKEIYISTFKNNINFVLKNTVIDILAKYNFGLFLNLNPSLIVNDMFYKNRNITLKAVASMNILIDRSTETLNYIHTPLSLH